jgi:translation initiation factor IF-2
MGGEVPFAGVSSKTGEGVPELLDLVLLTADLAELTADTDALATGFVLESAQDPKQGMAATLIVKDGALATGMFVIAGQAIAPVRFIENFAGTRIPSASASQPIRISGWNSLPPAGTPFITAATKKEAERLAAEGIQPARVQPIALEGGMTMLPLVVKADVTGSIAAIKHELEKINHERVTVRIVQEGIGAVSENDVKQAQASGAVVIAFHVGTDSSARELSERAGVPVETFSIIYDLKERVEELVKARAPKMSVEEITGEAKILKVFGASGAKQVMGARWVSGALTLGDLVKIDRRGLSIGTVKLTNLQVARADVKEIHVEGEFGLQLEGKAEAAAGDTIQTFRVVET